MEAQLALCPWCAHRVEEQAHDKGRCIDLNLPGLSFLSFIFRFHSSFTFVSLIPFSASLLFSLLFFFFTFPWSVLPSQGILGTFLPRSSLHTSPLHLSPRILFLARLLLYLTERELKITVLFIYHVNPVIKELLCALYPAYACANTSLFCRVPFHLSFFSSDLMEWYVCLGRVRCLVQFWWEW